LRDTGSIDYIAKISECQSGDDGSRAIVVGNDPRENSVLRVYQFCRTKVKRVLARSRKHYGR
jgi:hypothetical protein